MGCLISPKLLRGWPNNSPSRFHSLLQKVLWIRLFLNLFLKLLKALFHQTNVQNYDRDQQVSNFIKFQSQFYLY